MILNTCSITCRAGYKGTPLLLSPTADVGESTHPSEAKFKQTLDNSYKRSHNSPVDEDRKRLPPPQFCLKNKKEKLKGRKKDISPYGAGTVSVNPCEIDT